MILCHRLAGQATLRKHLGDKREYLYTREDFEQGRTHDDLWNAAQLEMVHGGKMHGYMRCVVHGARRGLGLGRERGHRKFL